MERRSRSLTERRSQSFADELALTKSAAWAWLEHRSGSERRSTPESEVSRTKFDAKPSRYRAEAVRKFQQSKKPPTHTNGYFTLLDKYDVESITRQLDHYIRSSLAKRRSSGTAEAEAEMKSKHGGKKVAKGLWPGSRAPRACGSSRDEVMNSSSSGGSGSTGIDFFRRRRRSTSDISRRPTAVEIGGCRPRQGIRA